MVRKPSEPAFPFVNSTSLVASFGMRGSFVLRTACSMIIDNWRWATGSFILWSGGPISRPSTYFGTLHGENVPLDAFIAVEEVCRVEMARRAGGSTNERANDARI